MHVTMSKDVTVHAANTMTELNKYLGSTSGLVVLFFSAPWCGPCKSITSVIQNLSSLYPDVTFVEVRRAVHVLC